MVERSPEKGEVQRFKPATCYSRPGTSYDVIALREEFRGVIGESSGYHSPTLQFA